MQLIESTIIALRALRTNKLRTALTMLGIIIGVSAVIALLAIGNGFRQQVEEQFGSLGVDVLFVQSGQFRFNRGSGPEAQSSNQKPPQPLTLNDAQALSDPLQAPDIAAVSPQYNLFETALYGQKQMDNRIIGVVPAYDTVQNATLTMGQFISRDQVDRRARVAVLGYGVAQQLFEPYQFPVGETIRIRGIPFEVIGVMAEKGGFFGADFSILIPLSTAQTRLGQSGAYRGSLIVSEIYVKAASAEQTAIVMQQMTSVLRQQHNLSPAEENDFTIQDQGEFLQQANTFTLGMTIFLGVIAGISLLVGGIGVMNIMLVSVTERTREIGIRKAVGAKRRDILLQFLVEAVVLSLLGGFVGIGLGYAISTGLPAILGDSFGTPTVTLNSILLATSFCIAIGVFFGVYPASRAARLKPIDALRYE